MGPYEVIAKLGAGGMGEVFRAKNTRLGREVALEILPADVGGDPVRKARFEQEARAVAALNHPNIVGVYDVGTQDGVLHIVTELVPGETVDVILQRGAVPLLESGGYRGANRRRHGRRARGSNHTSRPETGQRDGDG